jgi:hypothetical protein
VRQEQPIKDMPEVMLPVNQDIIHRVVVVVLVQLDKHQQEHFQPEETAAQVLHHLLLDHP